MIEQRETVGKIGANGAGMKCPNCSMNKNQEISVDNALQVVRGLSSLLS
ncbi:hypothetical protein LC048_00245 [Mesobacillus subterraneus]|nr:hypothetical protein [Mesobacillus subterraneus]WLR55493.1 hypothetical protein LC048_00245 [Mesobacillus subterraneus]